jgi:hypothetical protein
MEESIQILSSTEGLGERIFQLSPQPSEQWWRAWDRILRRWLNEVARLPPDVEITGSLPDEIVASGVTEENADALDRALVALVLAINRERAKPPK